MAAQTEVGYRAAVADDVRVRPCVPTPIAGALAGSDVPASFLLPTRRHVLFRWCLAAACGWSSR